MHVRWHSPLRSKLRSHEGQTLKGNDIEGAKKLRLLHFPTKWPAFSQSKPSKIGQLRRNIVHYTIYMGACARHPLDAVTQQNAGPKR